MDKLLHERLRSHDDEKSLNFSGAGYLIALYKHEAEILADEIERYYIPRPRFEDGEPLQFGDEILVEGNRAVKFSAMHYYEDEIRINDLDDPYYACCIKYGEPVKRPQPKVLDADGVEINVGDTVWVVDNMDVFTVTGIESAECVIIQSDDDMERYYHPNILTHKEPDSLEKLLDDMTKFGINTYFASLEVREPFDGFLARLSALIERGA